MSTGRRLLVGASALLVVGVGILFLAGSLFAPFGGAAAEGPGMALVGAVFATAGAGSLVARGGSERWRRIRLAVSAAALIAALWAFGLRAERVDAVGLLSAAACLVLLADALLRLDRRANATRRDL